MITHAVIQVCCDRGDGVNYFHSYNQAAAWRAEYERPRDDKHNRVGILLGVAGDGPPPDVGLEDHQLWVRIGDHWEVRGTGAL